MAFRALNSALYEYRFVISFFLTALSVTAWAASKYYYYTPLVDRVPLLEARINDIESSILILQSEKDTCNSNLRECGKSLNQFYGNKK
tara:strand:+ start:9830 stop:10093 length:264 start_codon:yes stop_codon:yes gene_type:complete